MSEQRTYRCDICKAEKREANHWWRGYLVAGDEAKDYFAGLIIIPWELPAEGACPPDVIATEVHLCGEQHVAEWVGRNLTVKKENVATMQKTGGN